MDELQRAADELAIRNLLANIAWQVDHAGADELDDYLACFTEDAEWQVANTIHADTRKGHDQIREGAILRREAGGSGPGSNIYHVVTGTAITFESAELASSRSYVIPHTVKFGVPSLLMMGEYRDQFRKTADGWKMCKRVVTFL